MRLLCLSFPIKGMPWDGISIIFILYDIQCCDTFSIYIYRYIYSLYMLVHILKITFPFSCLINKLTRGQTRVVTSRPRQSFPNLEVLLASTVQSDPDLAGRRPTRRSPAMSSMSRLGLVVRNFIFPPEVRLKNKPSQVFYGTFFRIQDSTHWDRLSRVVR